MGHNQSCRRIDSLLLPCFLAALSWLFPLCMAELSWSEERGPTTRLANQTTKRNAGSAARLADHVVLAPIFVDDDKSQWNDSDVADTERDLDLTMRFLSRQAALHGQQLAMTRVPKCMIRIDGSVPLDPHASPHWTEEALRLACKRPAMQEVDRLRHAHQAQHVAFCLHVNQPGISYNLGYYPGVKACFFAERAICFLHYPDGRRTATATLAHEILHLFGAGDLYFPYDQDETRKRSAASAFPDDIMFRVDYNLEQLMIGSFTAYRVGWLPTLDRRWRNLEDGPPVP